MTKPVNAPKFNSPAEEGKYVIENVKNNPKFRKNFFYGTGYYSLEAIRNYIAKCVRKSYGYCFDEVEFGSVMYEHCWAEGTWHPFDTYGGVFPFFAWLSKVAFHTVTAYLDELGYIKVKRGRTPKNTKVMLSKHSPAGCQLIIDEVMMPQDESRQLLLDIYVEQKPATEIMEARHIDAKQYEKMLNDAEDLFKFRVINSAYNFDDYVIADNTPGDFTVCIDNVYGADISFNSTSTNPVTEVFNPFGTSPDVATSINAFLVDVIRMLKWSETDTFVFLQRWEGVPAAVVAEAVGRSRDWVNTRFSRLRAVLFLFLKHWWWTHC